MPVDHLLLILAAAFGGGALNSAAGGGSFLTLPALVFIGIPPVVANATGTAALLPGYVASTWGFREDLQAPAGLSFPIVVLTSLMAGALGAVLLIVTDTQIFERLLPWLVLAATALFAAGPHLFNSMSRYSEGGLSNIISIAALAMVCVYGGYFNGGLGILLLAVLALLGETNLNTMNGIKSLVSVVITAIAVAVYSAGGLIAWQEALIMMFAAAAGAYAGARLIRKLSANLVRRAIIFTGLFMTVWFFLRS